MGSLAIFRRMGAREGRLFGPPLKICALAALALGLAGCATLDPYGQQPGAASGAALPPEAPRTTGVETSDTAQHKRLVEMFGGEYKSWRTERYLNGILAKLAAASVASAARPERAMPQFIMVVLPFVVLSLQPPWLQATQSIEQRRAHWDARPPRASRCG